jgi:protein-S-isoprenylcysteine O-methyltransferase Ste14
LVPWLLSDWKLQPPFLALAASRWAGCLLIFLGIPVLAEAFARFALDGRGTPAPYMLTERLVITGTYRYVRNPMYLAILSIVAGEAFLLGQGALLGYTLVLWCVFHLFVVWYEEPSLRRRYGREYESYCVAVRRWWPRTRAWSASPSV